MGDPLTYTVEQAAALLGVSRSAYYDAIKRGDTVPFLKIGRRIVVPRAQLEALLTQKGAA